MLNLSLNQHLNQQLKSVLLHFYLNPLKSPRGNLTFPQFICEEKNHCQEKRHRS